MSINKGTLYIVATPIGNLADITERAKDILASVDLVAVEDTRRSGQLLRNFNITTPMLAVHEHNERKICESLLEKLQQGQNIALISDAGTPLVSDPGFFLVSEARKAEVKVVPIPGVSAIITALSAAGLPTDRFIFEGFLPAKSVARKKKLENLADDERTLIFYEAPHRILDLLLDMKAIFGADRYVVIARELTKTFETIYGAALGNLHEWVKADENQQKGEFVVLVHGAEKQDKSAITPEAERILLILLAELPVKQAASLAAKISGVKKNLLYQHALELQQ